MNEVTSPFEENAWQLKEDDKFNSDEQTIAYTFNRYFVQKIVDLKDGIDEDYIVDPHTKLKKKMTNNNKKFKIKQFSSQKILKIMKKLNKKKSSGVDGLSHTWSQLPFIINQPVHQGREIPNKLERSPNNYESHILEGHIGNAIMFEIP